MWKVRSAGGKNPPREDGGEGGRRLLRHDVLFDGEADEVCRTAKAQNLKQLSLVVFDRADGDIKLGGDLFHALALGEQPQHVALPWRELTGSVFVRSAEISEHVSRDERRQVRPAGRHRRDRIKKLLARGLLEQVSVGARSHRFGREPGFDRAGFSLLAVSVGVDALTEAPYSTRYIIEDGSKFLGAVGWLGYFGRVCFRELTGQ